MKNFKKLICITNDGSSTIFLPDFNEYYHSKHGAIIESEHVFIKNGLLATKKNNVKILEVGFGSGLNTLLTSKYCLSEKIKTDYHSLEIYPIKEDIYNKLNFYRLVNIKKNDFISLHNSKWNVPFIVNKYFKLTKINIDLKKFTTNSRYDIIFFDAFSPITGLTGQNRVSYNISITNVIHQRCLSMVNMAHNSNYWSSWLQASRKTPPNLLPTS